MKKIFSAKVLSLILTFCFTFGLLSPINVFAMENTIEKSTESENFVSENIIPLAGNDIFNYAEVKSVGGFTFHSTNLTPVKTVGNDNRMHRLIFKIQIGRMDPGRLRNIKLRFTVRNAYGSDIASSGWIVVNENQFVTNDPNYAGAGLVNVFVPVSKNQQLQFYFEAKYDAPPGDRFYDLPASLDIQNYWIYCD